jgi:hypothetical protein
MPRVEASAAAFVVRTNWMLENAPRLKARPAMSPLA